MFVDDNSVDFQIKRQKIQSHEPIYPPNEQAHIKWSIYGKHKQYVNNNDILT